MNDVQAVVKDKYDAIRPWTRFFARCIDLILFAAIAGFAFGFYLYNPKIPIYAIDIIFLFTWMFIESILLSTWGTTPGKWLLGIELKDQDRNKLNFFKALKRSFWVWLRGLGIGIPKRL